MYGLYDAPFIFLSIDEQADLIMRSEGNTGESFWL